MQPCQALITSPDVLNKILPGKPGAVQNGSIHLSDMGIAYAYNQGQYNASYRVLFTISRLRLSAF